MENRIYDENNGLWYARQGEYYLLELALPPEEEKAIDVWGQRHLQYLKEHKQLVYINLLTSGRLNEYLASVDRGFVFSAGKRICRKAGSDGTAKGRKPAFMGSKNE